MNLAILILLILLLKGATLMNKEYLINQRPLKALLVFAFPIMIGNLFQQFYTMADSVVVGRFVGEDALAAVGASYSLTNVFISIAIGGGIGQSRLCMLLLGTCHIGEVQVSLWDQETLRACEKAGITLL